MNDEPELRCSKCCKRARLVGIEMNPEGIDDILTFECESGHFITLVVPGGNNLP